MSRINLLNKRLLCAELLQELLEKRITPEQVKSKWPLDNDTIIGIALHQIEHCIVDEDIREKDSQYARWQDQQIKDCMQQLFNHSKIHEPITIVMQDFNLYIFRTAYDAERNLPDIIEQDSFHEIFDSCGNKLGISNDSESKIITPTDEPNESKKLRKYYIACLAYLYAQQEIKKPIIFGRKLNREFLKNTTLSNICELSLKDLIFTYVKFMGYYHEN